MKTRTIWILAVLFGILASLAVYMFSTQTMETSNLNVVPNAVAPVQEPQSLEKKEKPELVIAKGKRAISISVDEEKGVSGFLKPGVFVDVVAIIPFNYSTADKSVTDTANAMLIMQNMKVLAAGKKGNLIKDSKGEGEATNSPQTESGADSYTTVTLEVTPEEGQKMALLKNKGVIQFMLRPAEDTSTISNPATINLETFTKGVTPR